MCQLVDFPVGSPGGHLNSSGEGPHINSSRSASHCVSLEIFPLLSEHTQGCYQPMQSPHAVSKGIPSEWMTSIQVPPWGRSPPWACGQTGRRTSAVYLSFSRERLEGKQSKARVNSQLPPSLVPLCSAQTGGPYPEMPAHHLSARILTLSVRLITISMQTQ